MHKVNGGKGRLESWNFSPQVLAQAMSKDSTKGRAFLWIIPTISAKNLLELQGTQNVML